ncbi:MAG: PAS domain S-box protein, partial [Actinomycetota bacterium]|nr:PAS domain S-box protein [Actinomycetota bacterium]
MELDRSQGQSESWLRLLENAVAASSNGIVITDADRTDNLIVYVNRTFELMTGYAADEALGRNCRFLQGSDNDQEALREVRSAVREGRGSHAVLRNYRKDGSLFWNELRLSPVYDEEGRLTHFVGVQDDVTERMLAEKAQRENEAAYARMAASAPGMVYRFVLRPDGAVGFPFVGGGSRKVYGLEPQEIQETPSLVAEAVSPEDRPAFDRSLAESAASLSPWSWEGRIVT